MPRLSRCREKGVERQWTKSEGNKDEAAEGTHGEWEAGERSCLCARGIPERESRICRVATSSVRPMCLQIVDGHRSGRLDFHQRGHRGLLVAHQACLLRASSVSKKSQRVRQGVYMNTNCSGQLPAHFVVLGQ